MKIVYLSIIIFLFSCDNNSNRDTQSISGNQNNHTSAGNQNNHISTIKDTNQVNYDKAEEFLASYYKIAETQKPDISNIYSAIKYFKRSILVYGFDSSFIVLNKLVECNIILRNVHQVYLYLNKSWNINNKNYESSFLRARASHIFSIDTLDPIDICKDFILSDAELGDKIPDDILLESYLLIANIYSERFEKEAVKYYDIVLDIDPLNTEALYGKALFYQNEGVEGYSEAQDIYYKIRDIKPFHIAATYNLGFIHMELHNYKLSVNYFTDVIVTNQNYYKAYYARGLCYERLGNVIYAEKDYRSALEIFPAYQEAKDQLENLLINNEKYIG